MARKGPAGSIPWGSGALAVEFVNSVGCGACRVDDGFASVLAARRWLADHREALATSKLPRSVPLSNLRGFRRFVRALFERSLSGSHPSSGQLRALKAIVAKSGHRVELRWGRAGPTVHRSVAPADAVTTVQARIGESAVFVLGGEAEGPLRRCHATGCAHFLLARTRRQLWCSPNGCGNRARAARHYWRTHRRPGPAGRKGRR